MEVETMLMRTDPFRELDRLTQQVFGTQGTMARPAVMPMDAWREGERNVVTVRAERPSPDDSREMLAAERPRGVFSRQLVLGDTLDTDNITADYDSGVLTLHIPVAEKSKPRKITIGGEQGRQLIGSNPTDRQSINA
jgi:HSP20 family protein